MVGYAEFISIVKLGNTINQKNQQVGLQLGDKERG